jgi:hypothetical protein
MGSQDVSDKMTQITDSQDIMKWLYFIVDQFLSLKRDGRGYYYKKEEKMKMKKGYKPVACTTTTGAGKGLGKGIFS